MQGAQGTNDVSKRATPAWWIAATTGALWLIVVALATAASLTPLSRVQGAVLPSGVTPYVWSWPAPWPVLFPVAGALAVGCVQWALLSLTRSRSSFVTTWLTTVAAGAVVGAAVDVVLVFGSFFSDGWAMWSLDLGSRAAVGAYWGLLYGWIPALVARREIAASSPAHRATVAVAAVVALVLVGSAQVLGSDATQAQLVAEQAAAEPAPVDGAARPDADAEGEPVPERADGDGVTGENACAADRAMVLTGVVDGATGHRGLRLELLNYSESPCVIEGYPDVAFGDQNEHLLDVTVERGSSFMAGDPGEAPVEIPAGGSAVAYLGWDANSTNGALVARTLWVAALAGETRGSTPLEADVIVGSTVNVTAWALPSTDPTTP